MSQSKYFVQEITVVGMGQFPIDMLRYDNCVPASENDSYEIQNKTAHREIRLRRFQIVKNDLAKARWASFGWFLKNS